MPCPRCGSNHLWDDNMWWGCEECGSMFGPDSGVRNSDASRDTFNQNRPRDPEKEAVARRYYEQYPSKRRE